jgi:uridylate kinase
MTESGERAVFLKLSGERLAQGNPNQTGWNSDAIDSVAHKIAQLHKNSRQNGLVGMTLVCGAGNLARGANLGEELGDEADGFGRLQTISNTVRLSGALRARSVPHVKMLTDRMGYEDRAIELKRYSPEGVRQAHQEGEVVLIAGGTGEDFKTTDQAVVFYAMDYHRHTKTPVMVLKGTTNVKAVYDKDPNKKSQTDDEAARAYKVIGADYMLQDYDRFKVVDRSSLEQLVEYDLSMLIYEDHDGVDPIEVLQRDPRTDASGAIIGTVIVPRLASPVLYGN